MPNESVLEIVAYGAWNGGTLVDNSIYEEKQMYFKGGIPVDGKTIEERIGVRTRKVAGSHERIGVTALQDLINTTDLDLSRIKLVIGATNVGDDKYDPAPIAKRHAALGSQVRDEALIGCTTEPAGIDVKHR